jgi:queuine tRNA-ribosyltransferase
LLPEDKPRYLMGLGRPEEIVAAVKEGIDMFDCVIPTREARHGRLYLANSKQLTVNSSRFYKTINITNSKYKTDLSPINQTNLKQYTKAYLHHLFKTNEPLGMRLATLNNLEFYLGLMSEIRQAIKKGIL